MSFTSKVKNELLKQVMSETEKVAFLSGFMRNNASLENDTFVLDSENKELIIFLEELLASLGDIRYELNITSGNNFTKKELYILTITSKVSYLDDLIAFSSDTVPSYIVDGEGESKAYLRGVFISSGSMNDPKSANYHMELLINNDKEAVFVQKLLNQFNLNAKLLRRDKGFMIYLKEAEKISDLLKILGATTSVLYYENVRAYHDQKNLANRLNNCEQANMDRVISTAMDQLYYIDILKENLAVELLNDKEKEALVYREKYKEASLKELSEIISLETGHKITKSGLNHRFRKIKELALKIEQQQR